MLARGGGVEDEHQDQERRVCHRDNRDNRIQLNELEVMIRASCPENQLDW